MKKEITITNFKAHCLEILNNLEKSQESVVITKRNKPIALISSFPKSTQSIFGIFQNQIEIKGDIVAPVDIEWEVDK